MDFAFNGQMGSPYRPWLVRDPLEVHSAIKATAEASAKEMSRVLLGVWGV
jgi:dTDP-4-dehydrorhamnose reductase